MAKTVRVKFLGASGCVTGSKFLLESEGKSVLVDCGLFQGRRELRKRNWDEPEFAPHKLDAIVLTHAHIDHTGYLPLVVKRGFKGPIYCTAATKDILELLLPDSAELQEEQARYYNKHKLGKHQPAKALYNVKDAKNTLKQLKVIERNERKLFLPRWSVEAQCAGHILGSVSLCFEINSKVITFSGDIGRYNTPILCPPKPNDFGDLVVCESTYGDRAQDGPDLESQLKQIVTEISDKKGPLIIPAFAVGRTQALLYHLANLERKGEIPVLPVYVDSPMAVDATRIYRRYKHDYDEDTKALLEEGATPLLTENVNFCRSTKESKSLNSLQGPRIIISASGMLSGGRVLHHLRNHVERESTTVLFVGYQAEGTRGRDMLEGKEEIKIFGKAYKVRARVESISGLSAHADQNELFRWMSEGKGSAKKVKIVHGEPEAASIFSDRLYKELKLDATPAEHLEEIEI